MFEKLAYFNQIVYICADLNDRGRTFALCHYKIIT